MKIDRQFIAALDSADGRGTAIVQGLVNLGHSLQLSVVGEGVETEAQARALHSIGCESAQGFFYGYPGPASQFLESEAWCPASSGRSTRRGDGEPACRRGSVRSRAGPGWPSI